MSPLLSARSLSVEVVGKVLISGLDLDLVAGECLAILGRNGAGKSTLLATLAGLRAPAAGAVQLAGQPIGQLTPRRTAQLRGWLGQHWHDPFAGNVLEAVLAGRHPHLDRWQWERAEDQALGQNALAEVGLAGFADRRVETLSGGERQRLAIATLLTQTTPLCLLDEPLSHLDLKYQMNILALFSRLAREENRAVAMVLHDPALAYRSCDTALLVLGDGQYVLGPVDEVLTAPHLSALYGHPVSQVEIGTRRCFVPE